MTLDTPSFVKIDVLEIAFFQDDSLLQRIQRCNQRITDYLGKIPTENRQRYRVHFQNVTPKRAAYGVYYQARTERRHGECSI